MTIYQFDTAGKFIQEHDSISLAAVSVGAKYRAIRDSMAKKIKVNKMFYFSQERTFIPPIKVLKYRLMEKEARVDYGFQKLDDNFLIGTY